MPAFLFEATAELYQPKWPTMIPLIKTIIILPGTALVFVPALIVWLTRGTAYAARFPPDTAIPWFVGLAAAGAGLALMIWTVTLFATKGGGGTPAPWEPIRNFIVVGPYRYVRNPMLLGVNLFLFAEAALLQSFSLVPVDDRVRDCEYALFRACGGTAVEETFRRGLYRLQAPRAPLDSAPVTLPGRRERGPTVGPHRNNTLPIFALYEGHELTTITP